MDRPGLEQIEEVAQATVAGFPAPFAELGQGVAIRVVDWVPDHLLEPDEDPQEMRETITGMYHGIPLTEKSVFDQPMGPDVVWLFRGAILLEWEDRDVSWQDLVAHVTVHEFAHHFGWSDADIAAIDEWWV